MDDLRVVHELDQRRERLKDVARDVAAYHLALVEGGMSEEAALELTSSLQDRLIVAAAPETARWYECGEPD